MFEKFYHLPGFYARHPCDDPSHLVEGWPVGLLGCPLQPKTRVVVTLGKELRPQRYCEHLDRRVSYTTIEVHFLWLGKVYHAEIPGTCVEVMEGGPNLSQEMCLGWLREGSL